MRLSFSFSECLQIIITFPERNESSVSFCILGVRESTEELPPVRKENVRCESCPIFFIVRSITLAVIFRSTKTRHRTWSELLLGTEECLVSVKKQNYVMSAKNSILPERVKDLDEFIKLW
jgi:hypothetical protein